MRILKAIGARPRRTIRVALWGGEEQGLLGSKAWVAQHLDGRGQRRGSRKVRCVLQYRQRHRADLRLVSCRTCEAVQPCSTRGWSRSRLSARGGTSIEPVGSTDHLSFTDAGVPGFNPIQDYVNYDVRTHHTNMDTVERVRSNDIRQAAAAMAWFAYSSAMNDQKIARPAPR